MSAAKKKGRLNFEATLKKLEAIVHRLEDEQAPLEESLKLFAEGKKLTKLCETELQEAENRIRQLTENEDGELALEPMADDDEDADEDEDPKPSASPESSAPATPSTTRDDLPF